MIFNATYKEIYKTLDNPQPTHQDIDKIRSLFAGNDLKHTPDFIFLEGLFNMRIKNYKDAKELFDKAIRLYEEGASPLSNQSAIIQNYVDLCKYIQ